MWPFNRIEKREASYTDAVVGVLLRQAHGVSVDAGSLAVVEACVGLWSRSLASATIEPVSNRLAGLTPKLLALVGRSLATTGNLVCRISVEGASVALTPVADFDITGSSDPASWRYRLNLPGPSSTEIVIVDAAGVVHFQAGASAEAPWRGVAPLRRSSGTAALAGAVESSLTSEARLPIGRIATYAGVPRQVEDYGRELIRGGLTITGATSGAVPGPDGQEPASRLKPQTYDPEPNSVMELLRSDTGRDIVNAFGISPALFAERGDGAGQRESWRRILARDGSSRWRR